MEWNGMEWDGRGDNYVMRRRDAKSIDEGAKRASRKGELLGKQYNREWCRNE